MADSSGSIRDGISSPCADGKRQAVFTWGFGKYGQLGNGRNDSQGLPQHITFDKGTNPVLISCGGHHTLVGIDYSTNIRNKKSGDGTVANRVIKATSCGRGLYGRLGNGSEADQNQFNVMAAAHKDINHDDHMPSVIAAGHWHGAYIAGESGTLYIWGYNKNNCTLGVAGLPPVVSTPTPLPIPISFRHVSCGFNYTLAVTTNNIAYSWGCGRNGVLAQGDQTDRATPTLIPSLSEVKIVKVSAGYCHSGFIAVNGTLYTCGKGSDGALGHGSDRQDKVVATQVQSLSAERVSCVSCSQGEHHSHTLITTDNGSLYSCGDGYKGKLGLGDDSSRLIPTKIPSSYFDDCAVTIVSAGGIHSAALAPGAGVFVWGCGSDGRLGLPEAIGHRYLFRSNVPRKVDLGKNWKPLDVSSSYYHTAVIATPI